MQQKSPRSVWFRERAEECRDRAKLRASSERSEAYLKVAAAYEALAEQSERGEEIFGVSLGDLGGRKQGLARGRS